jgi:hypothetical protein
MVDFTLNIMYVTAWVFSKNRHWYHLVVQSISYDKLFEQCSHLDYIIWFVSCLLFCLFLLLSLKSWKWLTWGVTWLNSNKHQKEGIIFNKLLSFSLPVVLTIMTGTLNFFLQPRSCIKSSFKCMKVWREL